MSPASQLIEKREGPSQSIGFFFPLQNRLTLLKRKLARPIQWCDMHFPCGEMLPTSFSSAPDCRHLFFSLFFYNLISLAGLLFFGALLLSSCPHLSFFVRPFLPWFVMATRVYWRKWEVCARAGSSSSVQFGPAGQQASTIQEHICKKPMVWSTKDRATWNIRRTPAKREAGSLSVNFWKMTLVQKGGRWGRRRRRRQRRRWKEDKEKYRDR